MNEKEVTRISKFLSLVLRHKPETIGIAMDEHGWVNVGELIMRCTDHGHCFSLMELEHIVNTNNKKRFSFNEDCTKIRAAQGHSIEVNLGYKPQVPPDILYHGTGAKSVESILKTGLEKRGRQHVHLSKDSETAIKVGQRHGSPVVFQVRAGAMSKLFFEFFLSDNGVWLTDRVPPEYLNRMCSTCDKKNCPVQ